MAPGGSESRFLSMFSHQPPPPPLEKVPPPPYPNRLGLSSQQQSAAAAILQSLPYAQQQQIANTWLAARQQSNGLPASSPQDPSSTDKAAVRDHLLKLLGETPSGRPLGSFPLGLNNGAPPPEAPPPLHSGSRPMNPAAPNFAPSGRTPPLSLSLFFFRPFQPQDGCRSAGPAKARSGASS